MTIVLNDLILKRSDIEHEAAAQTRAGGSFFQDFKHSED